MQSEQDWASRIDADEEDGVVKRYDYFMRPEPREDLGPIETIHDEFLDRPMKTRTMKIGMVRNAKDENKKQVRVYLEPFPHIRIDKAKDLQGWYKGLHEPKGTRPRPCFTEAILTEPFGGYCSVGCSFCYINSGFRGYRGSGLITVPLNYGDQIKKQLSKMRRAAAGYFMSFSDPFLPLEEYYHNTQNAAQEFVNVGLPIFFLSRLRYPDWAIDLMKESEYSYAQKSINTPDPEDWRYLSPGALPLEEHFEDIARLKRNGIYVSIQCNPVVAGVTSNTQIVELFKKLKKAGADHVIVKFVEAGYSWAPTMVEKMIKRFGERGKAFEKLFTENIGGQRTINEAYRLKAHRIYSAAAKDLGLTYATCYEYRKERNESGEIINSTGISIGREFTTASQCHGKAVPVFTRNSAEESFRPVNECPASGCLYCASENGGQARCGDTLAGEAHPLRLVDLKLPIGYGESKLDAKGQLPVVE